MNLINYLDAAIDPQIENGTSSWMVVLGLLSLVAALVVIIIIVVAVVKDKKKAPQQGTEILQEEEEPKKEKNKKPKEIPIKKPSMIDDPANVRMAIEEAKADLSEFNVKQEEKPEEIEKTEKLEKTEESEKDDEII